MKKGLLLFVSVLVSFHAYAGIQLQKGLYQTIDGGKQTYSMVIANTGDTTQYVKVEISKILNPLKPHEKDKVLSVQEMAHSIMATPQRVIIPAHEKSTVRFYFPSGRHNTADQFYRVQVMPVLPTQKNGFNVDKEKVKKMQATMRLSIGYGVLLIVRPLKTHYGATAKRDQMGNIVLTNTGNSVEMVIIRGVCKSALLQQKSKNHKARFCSKTAQDQYVFHLYAGHPKKIPFTQFAPQQMVKVEVGEGKKSQSFSFPIEMH